MYMWSFVIFKFPVSNSCQLCSLAIRCFLVLITITATLLEIQLSWFYKKCYLSCSLMNWIELNFWHSKWPCCCFLGCNVQSTLTNVKKSFYCWNVARNSSKTSLKCVNDTWRVLLGSPIRNPSSCWKGGYHEPLDSWIVFGRIYSLDSCIHALNNWAQVGQGVGPRQHVILWPSSWQALRDEAVLSPGIKVDHMQKSLIMALSNSVDSLRRFQPFYHQPFLLKIP